MDAGPIENLRLEGAEIKLTRGYRSDGTALPRVTSEVSAAPSPYRRNDTDDGAGRRRDNDRRDRDGGRAPRTKRMQMMLS